LVTRLYAQRIMDSGLQVMNDRGVTHKAAESASGAGEEVACCEVVCTYSILGRGNVPFISMLRRITSQGFRLLATTVLAISPHLAPLSSRSVFTRQHTARDLSLLWSIRVGRSRAPCSLSQGGKGVRRGEEETIPQYGLCICSAFSTFPSRLTLTYWHLQHDTTRV
jgi:hypothetical protein